MRPIPVAGLRRENFGTSASLEKFQPPIAIGAASAATKVAPRIGRMIRIARAPLSRIAGHRYSARHRVLRRDFQRVAHEVGELPGRDAPERVDGRGRRDTHRRGRQFDRARDLAFLARLVEALRCRLFCAFLPGLSHG